MSNLLIAGSLAMTLSSFIPTSYSPDDGDTPAEYKRGPVVSALQESIQAATPNDIKIQQRDYATSTMLEVSPAQELPFAFFSVADDRTLHTALKKLYDLMKIVRYGSKLKQMINQGSIFGRIPGSKVGGAPETPDAVAVDEGATTKQLLLMPRASGEVIHARSMAVIPRVFHNRPARDASVQISLNGEGHLLDSSAVILPDCTLALRTKQIPAACLRTQLVPPMLVIEASTSYLLVRLLASEVWYVRVNCRSQEYRELKLKSAALILIHRGCALLVGERLVADGGHQIPTGANYTFDKLFQVLYQEDLPVVDDNMTPWRTTLANMVLSVMALLGMSITISIVIWPTCRDDGTVQPITFHLGGDLTRTEDITSVLDELEDAETSSHSKIEDDKMKTLKKVHNELGATWKGKTNQ